MRFPARTAHQSVAVWVQNGLDGLGWNATSALLPSGALHYVTEQPDEHTLVKPNTVAITIDPSTGRQTAELGDGLQTIDVVFFVDIYCESDSASQSVADDLVDMLGTPGSQIPLLDFTDPLHPVDDTATLEISKVQSRRPPAAGGTDWNRHWIVVAFTGTLALSVAG